MRSRLIDSNLPTTPHWPNAAQERARGRSKPMTRPKRPVTTMHETKTSPKPLVRTRRYPARQATVPNPTCTTFETTSKTTESDPKPITRRLSSRGWARPIDYLPTRSSKGTAPTATVSNNLSTKLQCSYDILSRIQGGLCSLLAVLRSQCLNCLM